MTNKASLLPGFQTQKYLSAIFAFLAAIVIYGLILFFPIPAAIGLFVRYNLALLTLIMLPIIYFVFRLKGGWGTFSGLTVTLLLFGLPLSGLWQSGASEPFIIGGLLPFSDAASYYTDALRVVEGFRFSAFSARRPLFPALLTVLLAVTGQNLILSLAILSALIAVACFLAAREIQRSYGNITASIFLFVLFLFYRRISGTTMTENLGLPLGVSAFVILWGSARSKRLWQTALGLLILTLALNARAGTFFILPALILWAGFSFKGSRRFSFSAVVVCTVAVALGFGLNMLVFKLVADPGGMVFSNFSYTLYGVVAGGKGWMQILIDHPELAQLDDVSRSAQTYQLVWDAWLAHPFNILIGAFKNWFDYLMPRGAGAFGFIRGNESISWINYTVRILLSLLAAWGLVISWKKRNQEPYRMMIWAAAGTFLSVPFVPPNDSNQMRVYAATVTFLIAFCGIGLNSVIGLIKKEKVTEKQESLSNPVPSLFFGITLALVAIGGVLLVKVFNHPRQFSTADCPAGQSSMLIHVTRDSMVQIVDRDALVLDNQLSVPIEGFTELFEGYPDMHQDLVEIVSPGMVISRSLDLVSLDYPLLVFNSQAPLSGDEYLSVCIVPAEREELARRGWWQVDSIQTK